MSPSDPMPMPKATNMELIQAQLLDLLAVLEKMKRLVYYVQEGEELNEKELRGEDIRELPTFSVSRLLNTLADFLREFNTQMQVQMSDLSNLLKLE
jgi:hypothetical protein